MTAGVKSVMSSGSRRKQATLDKKAILEKQAIDRARREKILEEIPKERKFLFFHRPLTSKERMERIRLALAEDALLEGGDTSPFGSPTGKGAAPQPAARWDRLDIVRVIATLIMVTALFGIVAVVVVQKNPSTSLYQLVSLASGLAGIGLGWLFGAAARNKK